MALEISYRSLSDVFVSRRRRGEAVYMLVA
jgi:hypothetical protein